MIKHIVLWKLKDEAEGRSKIENAHLMKTKLEALPLMISELNSVEVGVNIFDNKEASTCDLVLIAECDNEENLGKYALHPEHKKVVEFIVKVTCERRVVDYLSQ